VLLLAAGCWAWWQQAAAFDDAYITYRYAENWVAGHGLVFDPGGERVEGYSNPLWLAFSAAAIALGFDIPLRKSGNIDGTPGGMLMGPEGFFEMPDGIIRAERHVHMHPEDAAHYGVVAGDRMKLKIGGSCAVTFDEMLVRVDESFKFEVHIDTDEGNAVDLKPDTPCELVK
jgi:putative phosphotransacetylase